MSLNERRHYVMGGIEFEVLDAIELSAAESSALEQEGRVSLHRQVVWPLPDSSPAFDRAFIDDGGTPVWGPGPYLKVPNRRAGADWEAVNRVFCPWGYPPDVLSIAPGRSAKLVGVSLERTATDTWEWVLSVETASAPPR